MTESSYDDIMPLEVQRVDGISCIGSSLIFMLILFIMGTIMGGSEIQSDKSVALAVTKAPQHTRAAIEQALAQVTTTATSQFTETTVPAPTNTTVASPTSTATATATSTGTEQPTLPPATVTATPPVESLTTLPPTPTQTPLPLPTPQGIYSWTLKVPVLMYHYISIPPEGADKYRIGLSVAPEDFRQQMTYLAENGYNTIDFYDLSLAIVSKGELPPKPVIITIDDGYRDNYEVAFPILQELDLTATVFLATEFMDQEHPGYLSWGMVEEMAAAGIRFEPHTKTHVDLRDRDRDFLIYQLLGSQETIAAHIGYTPRYFAYPSGRYDDAVIQVLHEIGYWGAVTTFGGKWHGFNDRYEWTRLRVRNNTPLPEFVDLVSPGDSQNGKRITGN
jgi:peptidoglycan/xylan/chitin deacetylase (PgdA/CDA1 family)